MRTQPQNFFVPPSAYIADAPDVTPGSPIKAVLVGLAVDLGGTILAGVILGIGYGIFLAAIGLSQAEIVTASKSRGPTSFVFLAGVFAGLIFSVLGGYICARIAKHAEYRLAAIMVAISSVLGFLLNSSQQSMLVTLILMIAGFAATMLGARIGYLKNHRP